MGLFTAGSMIALLMIFVTYRVGWQRMVKVFLPKPAITYDNAADLPEEILGEMIAKNMILENAENPTGAPLHNTFLVQPDTTLGYVLRPNVTVIADMLRPTQSFNFDPPVLYRLADTKLSQQMEEYLNLHSMLTYSFRTNENGQRLTLPVVRSDNKILLIGDSVSFGVGVDDSLTIASHLQSILGDGIQIVNAGVGGYNGDQAIKIAEQAVRHDDYTALIYIACQNDFMGEGDWSVKARHVMKKLDSVSKSFDGRVIVLLQTYMQYNYPHIFQSDFWSQTDSIRETVHAESEKAGIIYLDWSDAFEAYERESGSPFAGFALYVDHCHFSPLGNSLAAQMIAQALDKWDAQLAYY